MAAAAGDRDRPRADGVLRTASALFLAEGTRVLLAGIGSALLMALGVSALFLTSAPAWISLLLEPVSLLMTPGVAASLLFTRHHDYEQAAVLRGAFAFYFVLVYAALRMRERRRTRA